MVLPERGLEEWGGRPRLAAVAETAGDACATRFETQGFEIIEPVLDEAECRIAAAQVATAGMARGGERDLLGFAWCRELARRVARHFGIARRLPPQPVALQATLFDKSPAHNWRVAFHQDLSVPVRDEAGVLFVQLPVSMLERLVVARVHVDDCGSESGALRIVPRSHRFGRLSAPEGEMLRARGGEVLCEVARGGVLLMRPLLLHASARTSTAAPRRVIHFVFGPTELREELSWRDWG
jgi:hypothetical protein